MSSPTRIKIAAAVAAVALGALTAGALALRGAGTPDTTRASAPGLKQTSVERHRAREVGGRGEDHGGGHGGSGDESTAAAEPEEVVVPETTPAVVVDPDDVGSKAQPEDGYEAEGD